MTIWNLGSINVDHVYQVPEFVAPGETLTARHYSWGLGGKGLNQSIAALRSGGQMRHLGAIGQDDSSTLAALHDLGLPTPWRVEGPTGHAVIQVNSAGENCIVLAPGANQALSAEKISHALSQAQSGDWLLLQNETNGAQTAVDLAKSKGLKICYAAAPFEPAAVAAIIDHIDLLSVNEVELAQLKASMDVRVAQLVTLGAKGAYYQTIEGARTSIPAYEVTPLDTTGAGDTFLGVFLARLDRGDPLAACLRWASAAAAVQVTRVGAASVIPTTAEIETFLLENKFERI